MGVPDVKDAKRISLHDSVCIGKKVQKGVYDPAATTQYAGSAQWEGISVKADGSAYQNSRTVMIEGPQKVLTKIDPNNKPKIVINASKVRYMTRSLIMGNTGENALTPWMDGNAAPNNTIYLKSVKLIDKAHGKIYGLNVSGQWLELKGDHPVIAPNLTDAKFNFAGGPREITLPEALRTSDEKMGVSAVVEYGIDVSKIDPGAMKQYGIGSNPDLLFDPNEGIMAVYNNRIRFTGYHKDNSNRIFVDPYDPTKPYNQGNPYNAGRTKLAPINLDVSVKY